MAMGRRKKERQGSIWVESKALRSPGHVFYEKVNSVLKSNGFDEFVETRCARFYAEKVGRPSIPPGVYFRMLIVGFFERLESERGIAWRCADSLALREFLGLELHEDTPDHSSLSRIRQMVDVETHNEVFIWITTVVAKAGLIKGKILGVDSTTLEANAALRSILRRDTGEGYDAFLKRLAKESGIKTPTREDLAKLDRKRTGKGSNAIWTHPHDPGAQIAKMKNGRTHLAHKNEHVVDMESGAVLAVTVHGGVAGDAQIAASTLEAADATLFGIQKDAEAAAAMGSDIAREVVGDKGYHSNALLTRLASDGYRTYISEPKRGRRKWKGKEAARKAVAANRRRIRGGRGKRLLRRRGELLERAFTHYLDGGGMRRTHLRGHENILKRLLIHVGGFNLGLMMRSLLGRGTPKEFAGAFRRLFWFVFGAPTTAAFKSARSFRSFGATLAGILPRPSYTEFSRDCGNLGFSTGC